MGNFGLVQWNQGMFGGSGSGIAGTGAFLVSDILYVAHRLVGLLGEPGRLYSPEQESDAMNALWTMVDAWGIQQYIACYSEQRTVFTLVSLQPTYSIGLDTTVAPDIAIQRPVLLRAGGLIFTNSTPSVETPMRTLSDQEWAALSPKTLSSTVPYMLYYNPTVPNGTLYVWPIPVTAWDVALYSWIGLQQFVSPTDLVVMPPAYREALQYNLALRLADMNPTRAKLTSRITRMAAHSLDKIRAVNQEPVLMQSEAGSMGVNQSKGRYNIISNSWSK